ncbi:LLM class flavin-dependent oxidoreductase, partial [Pseudomonas sp. C98]|nr:LLM class flavin-dependent oxidoreductase [Pseudomonas mercuritolerans]
MRGAVVLGAATATGALAGTVGGIAAPAPAHAAVPGFPTFRYLGQPLDRSALRYNPTNELIFPSVRYVAGRVEDPLGRWYMYYAPHDAPGGICLAYADSVSTGRTPDDTERVRSMLTIAKHADEAGLDVFATGEHHNPPFVPSSPTTMLGYLTGVTKNIVLSTSTTLITTNDPVRLAE